MVNFSIVKTHFTGFIVHIFIMQDIPNVQDADINIGIKSCFRLPDYEVVIIVTT